MCLCYSLIDIFINIYLTANSTVIIIFAMLAIRTLRWSLLVMRKVGTCVYQLFLGRLTVNGFYLKVDRV